MRKSSLSTCFLPILLLLLPLCHATAQVRSLSMREMVGAAGIIFIGTVTQAQGGTDEHGDIVTYTTFSVEQSLYGNASGGITVKQLGGLSSGMNTELQHMRYFRRGERVLVMFYPVSSLGFTSPIGLNQGAWRISSGAVQGVSDDALQGVSSLMKKYGLRDAESQSVSIAAFTGLIGDLLKEAGKR